MSKNKLVGYIIITDEWEYDDNAYNLNGRVEVGSRLYRTREEVDAAVFAENKAQFVQSCSDFGAYEFNFSEWGLRNEVREKYQAIAEKTLALLAPELTRDTPRRIRPEAFALIHTVDPSNFTDEDYRFLFNTWECLNVAHGHEIHEE